MNERTKKMVNLRENCLKILKIFLFFMIISGFDAYADSQNLLFEISENGIVMPNNYQKVVIEYPENTVFSSWKLAHKLEFAAKENSVKLKRRFWRDLAEALNQSPIAKEPKDFAIVTIAQEKIAIYKVKREKNNIEAILLLSNQMVRKDEGKFHLELETNLEVTQGGTQRVTSWPIAASLAYETEPKENQTLEAEASYSRTFISQKALDCPSDDTTCNSTDSTPGKRGLDLGTVTDSQEAELKGNYLFAVARETAFGRVDIGITATANWERDKEQLLLHRFTPAAGGEFRLKSEKRENQELRLSIKAGTTFEDYLLQEEPRETERTVLPILQSEIQLTAPIYQLNDITVVLFEAQAISIVSLTEAVSVDSQTQEELKSRINRIQSEAGLTFKGALGIGVKSLGTVEAQRNLANVEKKIEDLQWGYKLMLTFEANF